MSEDQTQYEKGIVYKIPLKDIKPDPKQPRKYFNEDSLKELQESIKSKGVIQPILFRKDEKGKLFIVAGERRFRASKNIKQDTIPGILVDGDVGEISLIENLLREDLTAVEEAEALKRLKDENEYTDEKIAAIIGKAQSTISDMMLIVKLPDNVKNECRENPVYSRRELIKIARNKSEKSMRTAFKRYKESIDKREQERKRERRKEKEAIEQSAIDTISSRLDKVQSVWSKEDKRKIKGNLESLKKKIEEILDELQ